MWFNPVLILLIFASIIVDFFLGEKIYLTKDKKKCKSYLLISMAFNLGMLAFFKYFGFFEDNFLWLYIAMGYEPSWVSWNIILPVGISFYTFQTMSYTIDIYHKKLTPVSSFLDFAVFVSFFPQLVAGPIIRAKDFLPEINKRKFISFDKEHILVILKGLFKKVVIADNLGLFVDMVYTSPETYPSVIIWMAAICFSVQIYCDFSGYTDIAIGLAAILGFNFPDNFNRPYFASTPSDFWRKWHISLSSWLRDYLYISLGGNRGGVFYTYRNLMLTMLLGGLWHGASWNFVLWGFLHGFILVIYRIFKIDKYLAKSNSKVKIFISTVFFQIYVLLTWITFRLVDFDKMIITLKKFFFFDFNFAIQNIGLGKMSFFSTLILLILFWILHTQSYLKGGIEERWKNMNQPLFVFYLFITGITLFFFWPTQEIPFIYFQF